MDSNLVVGLVVSALAVLVGLFISLATPLIKLNRTIQKLNDMIDSMEKDSEERAEQFRLLHQEVDKHSRWLQTDKQRLDNQGARLQKLDGQVGYVDNEKRI